MLFSFNPERASRLANHELNPQLYFLLKPAWFRIFGVLARLIEG
jgi:hypothetical protein